jgi:hypothetical protein
MSAQCSTCHAPIRWAVFAASGRRAPLDYEPSPDGNLMVIGQSNGVPLIAIADTEDGPLYKNHFATCPQADEHRRGS